MFNKKISLQFSSHYLLLINGSGLIIFADQAIKYKIRHFGGFYICNQGVAFGLIIPPIVFWLILGIFLSSGLFYFKHLANNKHLSMFSFVLIIGGALSNGADRFFSGCVTDFLTINWTFFPIFNIADIAIFTGCFLILVSIFSKKTNSCV